MRKLMESGVALLLFVIPMLFCFGLLLGIEAVMGASSDINCLGVFGPNTAFTCEWVSPDGQQAILKSPGGHRRFIDVTATVVVGKQYRRKTFMPHRHVQRSFLTEA